MEVQLYIFKCLDLIYSRLRIVVVDSTVANYSINLHMDIDILFFYNIYFHTLTQ